MTTLDWAQGGVVPAPAAARRQRRREQLQAFTRAVAAAWRAWRAEFGIWEWISTSGAVMLLVGLWLWLGPGPALTVVGGIVLTLGILGGRAAAAATAAAAGAASVPAKRDGPAG